MKASLTWMNEYVPVDQSQPQVLADQLTQAGIPVEDVIKLDAGIKKVYTGKIVEIKKHPDADKLVVCQIECLSEEGKPVTKQIVTGAKNVEVGQVVPVAYHKSRLPDGKEIKKGKLRGVVSEGMLCSVAELGISKDLVLPEEANGIYILPEGTPIGKDIKDVLGLNDIVYEFELTPNRADCFSMIGLSREFAVLTNKKVSLPEVLDLAGSQSIDGQLTVHSDNGDLCPQFTARLVKNVTVAPSPLWMQNRLRSAGIRPINNVVDVTNYVMLEYGQPMHAYNYDKLAGHSLTARLAKAGESLKTLDGTDRALTEDMLVIADAVGPVGVAGVMGGFDSEVGATTKTVVFEAANFNGASIRRTARALGMRSEASGRFERGVVADYTIPALHRAVELLKKICPAAEVVSGFVKACASQWHERKLKCTVSEINAYLGTEISGETMVDILTRLGFEVSRDGDNLFVSIPAWRNDVSLMPDIAEEVARIYGYDNIKVSTPRARLTCGTRSASKELERAVRKVLVEQGLSEMITFSFMHKDSLTSLLLEEGDSRYQAVPILNPISEEFPYMRTTLVPSLLEALKRNVAQRNTDVWAFEIAKVYEPKALPLVELPREHAMACAVMTGQVLDSQWSVTKRQTDFFDLKGVLEALWAKLGLAPQIRRSEESYLHPGVSAEYYVGDAVIARFGKLHPQVATNFEVPEECFLLELDLDALLDVDKVKLKYAPISKFPGSTRDLAIVAPKDLLAESVEAVLYEAGGEFLEKVFLFDVYEGERVAAGHRSLAYSLTFRSPEGTLTDEVVDGAVQQIIKALGEKGCELR